MMSDLEHLTRLLRTELTAVHQQFFHMLALRQWKERNVLSRITEVDTEDFKNAMQIIELLVSRDLPIALPAQHFLPGSDISSILQSEFRMEQHFEDVLDVTHVSDPEAVARINRAAAPRKAYREWLAKEFEATNSMQASRETKPCMADLVAHLIELVEQAMLHAFLHWHRGKRNWADNAWRLSGAAMLYETALVRRAAVAKAIPEPSAIAPVEMAASPSEAFAADILLVTKCAELAQLAGEREDDEATRRLCLRIADDCSLIANMEVNQDFPAVFGRSPVFESFAATREKHVL